MRMKFARTVCGDIQAEEMGFTYPHEHLYAVPPTCQKDRDLEVSDYEGSVAELKLFKSVGGQTLVEASTLDYGRNLSLLKKMSEETGIELVATNDIHYTYAEDAKPHDILLCIQTGKKLSDEKGMQKEYALYETVEKEAGQLIMEKRKMFKPVCANVDFYSGFVYSMLGIPEEMFTPMFATSRISGWCAHRLEELVNAGKIIRPAYKYVGWHRDYPKMEDRK